MSKEIKVSFRELRQTTNRIIGIVSDVTGIDKHEINLKTSINNDLGVDGDDWNDVLHALYEKEHLVLDGMNFYDFFWDEAQIASAFTLNVLALPFRFLIYLLTLSWKHTDFKDFGSTSNSIRELTIGDLVTSKFEGRFVERQHVKFSFR